MTWLVGERDQRAIQTAAKALESEIDHRAAAIRSLALRASSSNLDLRGEILATSDYLLQDFDGGLAFYDRNGKLVTSIGN